MSAKPAFIYHEDTLKYRFNSEHPFNQQRVTMAIDLLHKSGALDLDDIYRPRKAADDELLWVHGQSYIDAVKALSMDVPNASWQEKAEKFGLHTEDTPFFPGMHEATSTIVGGSIEAAELVMSGKRPHALHLGGGLHHAMANRGSGFCVYNDASVAIAYIRQHYGGKVLYIDTDVHHGDGVQWSFYTEPDVCTYSIHETGKYLFPGTGAVNERGDGIGFGYCYNIPLEPYTEDESWLANFRTSIERVTAFFKPDVIISQHGCDAHAFDPLSHLHCSMNIYAEMPRIIHDLAHQACNGRWIALGGGGYDIWRVVPRAWSMLWLEMSDHPLMDAIRRDPLLPLPAEWHAFWQRNAPVPMPTTWLDDISVWPAMPRREAITEKNMQTTEIAMQYIP